MKILTPIYRWLNKSDLKEFVIEQNTFNKVIVGKLDTLIDVIKERK